MSKYYHVTFKGKRYKLRKNSVLGVVYSDWALFLTLAIFISILGFAFFKLNSFPISEVNPWCGI